MKKNYSILIAILLFFNLSLFSQTAPPWDFNGTVENFVGSNYSSIVAGNSYATYTITSPNGDGNGGSANPNMKNTDAMIDTSAGNYIALTIQNTTANTRVQVITTVNGSNAFTSFDGLTANDTGFVTHYINMSSNANWSGTLGTINFRFKESASNSQNVFSGDILVDNIEIVASIPATPRVDYTFDDPLDSEGFVAANGVTISQIVAGELHLDIDDQSPYPKLEQSGIYSVDADTYKYLQVTLVNNSPKNKLTFVSPSGGNEFSTTDMTVNSADAQTVEIDLTNFTNWSGTQSSWWFQLVENPGDGAVSSAGAMDIQQILFASESINPTTNALMLQGIMDFTVPEGGSGGKATHLYANEDIADLSVYSVQMYANGGTNATATTQLPALAVTAGQHILIAREVEVMEAYLNASVTFDHVIDGGSFPSGNGDDVVELVMDGSGIEAYGVIGVDGDDEAWNGDGFFDYTDTWAYKVDGTWTAAAQDSSDGTTTTCDSSEPYPAVDCTNWPASGPTAVVAPWSDDFEDADASDWSLLQAGDASQGWILANGTNGSIVMYHADDNVATGVDNYLVAPMLDMSGLTSPLLSYSERGSYPTYYTYHGVLISSDYAGDVAAATWTVLTEGVAPSSEEVKEFSIPSTTTGIAFRYQGDYSDTWEIDNVSVTEAPTAPAMEVSATTDGGSATFSFDIENFTVGASGDTGVDGHIHYSLNGGSTVMIYSADDLTLTGLPNGDHSIVFSLVDASHNPLDPAVESTVAFSTFDGTAACGDTVTYTQVNGNTYTLTVTASAGQNVSVTVNGQLESNYDSMTITDSTGTTVNAEVDGVFQDAVYTADGTMTITVSNDSSVNYGDMTFAFACASSQSNVTFSVDMSNYPGGLGADDTVHLNGSFAGWCGDCIPMSDDDGDGIWTVTIPLDDGDYEYKFTVNGWSNQEQWPGDGTPACAENADDGTYENRAFTVAGADLTLQTVYWNLCIGEEPGETYTVTFSVNTANITVGANGIYAGGGVLGNAQALELTDDDNDNVWVGSIDLPEGTTGNYIFLNSPNDGGDWGAKENLEGQDCADVNNYNDRILDPVTADTTLLACFGECSGNGTGECASDECPDPQITSWTMTGDGAIFDGNNQDGITGYQIEYSTSTFTPGDGTASVYEFDSFPHTMTGLESVTTYYFTIRSICGDNNYSPWIDNGNDGPDQWTTTLCPGSYSLPYLNDFNDPDTWTNCQTFYDNDGDGQFWYYANYVGIEEAGNNVAVSASYNGGALTPDNWVIMGPIDLTDHSDALLEWKVRGIDPSWCQENYSVYVGSSYDYNDLINGSVSYNETIASGGDACGQTFADRSLDISAASGGLVYIGFRHHDVSDMFVLNVDDVSVTSSTMSNEDFTLENIDYTFNQQTNTLRVISEELLSNIQIYNMLGQEVLSKDLNNSLVELNLSYLSSAVYIVNVKGNNGKSKTFKLAIK